jgi:hypothetical protein
MQLCLIDRSIAGIIYFLSILTFSVLLLVKFQTSIWSPMRKALFHILKNVPALLSPCSIWSSLFLRDQEEQLRSKTWLHTQRKLYFAHWTSQLAPVTMPFLFLFPGISLHQATQKHTTIPLERMSPRAHKSWYKWVS